MLTHFTHNWSLVSDPSESSQTVSLLEIVFAFVRVFILDSILFTLSWFSDKNFDKSPIVEPSAHSMLTKHSLQRPSLMRFSETAICDERQH